MTVLRSLAALVAGGAAVMILVMMAVFLQGTVFPEAYGTGVGTPPTAMIVVNLVLSGLAAVAGGWVTAKLAPARPVLHGLVLAAVLIFLNTGEGDATPAAWPGWYARSLIWLPALALLGAWIAARREEPRAG